MRRIYFVFKNAITYGYLRMYASSMGPNASTILKNAYSISLFPCFWRPFYFWYSCIRVPLRLAIQATCQRISYAQPIDWMSMNKISMTQALTSRLDGYTKGYADARVPKIKTPYIYPVFFHLRRFYLRNASLALVSKLVLKQLVNECIILCLLIEF